MRVNIVNQGTGAGGGFDIAGATLTGPLILADDPKVAMEAATKRYIDTAVNSLNAGHIVTGTLPVGRLPAFSGDLTNVAGTNSFTLSNTAVTPGTYTKVTVDAKGRVTAGTSLTAADIPALNFNKITTNKPSTVDGYGITDAVKSTTDSMTGALTLHAHPTAATHTATKGYVDTATAGSAVLAVGDTIRRTNTTTPTGFLRCNGGVVSKTTYSALYAVISEPYNVYFNLDSANNVAYGAGQPWKQQYLFNSTQSGNITNWVSAGNIPLSLQNPHSFVTKNRVYLFGGFSPSTTYGPQMYTAVINADGTLGTWSESSIQLPAGNGLIHSQVVVIKNNVYILGGHNGSTVKADVYKATINEDGTITGWSASGTLPAAHCMSQAMVTKTRVYLLGGHNGNSAVATVYTAPIDSNGLIGSWTTASALPGALAQSSVAVTKNRVYLLGGVDGNGYGSTVYTAPINNDGTLGTWTTGTAIPPVLGHSQCIVSKNHVYLLGGFTNGSSSATYYAPINADGTIGTWSSGTALAATTEQSTVIVTSSKVYLLAGYSTGYTSLIQAADLSGGSSDYSLYYNGAINKFDGTDYSGSILLGNNYPGPTLSYPGAGKPWLNQYTFSSFDVTNNWSSGGTAPYNIDGAGYIVTKNYIHIIGGRRTDTYGSSNQTTSIVVNADGTMGSWTTGPSLPVYTAYFETFVYNNYAYVIGGSGSSAIYRAPINSDGTLGAWVHISSFPLGPIANSASVVTANRVYLIGGTVDGAASNKVYTASINADGTLSAWSEAANFPIQVHIATTFVTKDRVYLIGGRNGSGYLASVYTAAINADGTLGTWSAANNFPMVGEKIKVVVTNKMVYACSTTTNATYKAPVNADGTIGTWAVGPNMPANVNDAVVVVVKDKIHSISGLGITNIYTLAITGGLNDYSAYYGGVFTAVDPNTFTLPDTTATDPANIYTFIKF